MGRSILADLEESFDFGSIVVNTMQEIAFALDTKNAKKMQLAKSNSTKYSILKKYSATKFNNLLLFKLDWDCQHVLKYFDLDSIYKSAEIVIREGDMKSNFGGSILNHASAFIIFRGHDKKKDNALLLDNFVNYRDKKDNMSGILGRLTETFLTESKFNAMINRVRNYNKLESKTFKFIKLDNEEHI